MISYVKNPFLFHILNILIGFALQIYIFEKQFFICLLSTLFCYLCMKYFPNKKLQAYSTLTVAMLFLSGIHIYRMIVDYGNWTLDVNVIIMMNVCKYSSVAFCYYDSERDEKDCTDYMIK